MATRPFPSTPLPLSDRPNDYETLVEELEARPPDELRQARTHHRRALEALRGGAYESLSTETRAQLVQRFHMNLKALNEALKDSDSADSNPADTNSADTNSAADSSPRAPSSTSSSTSLFQRARTWIW